MNKLSSQIFREICRIEGAGITKHAICLSGLAHTHISSHTVYKCLSKQGFRDSTALFSLGR